MSNDKQVGLLYEAWADLDRVTDGLEPIPATQPLEQGSSIAWAVAHVTNHLDRWMHGLFVGLPLHPFIGHTRFRFNGGGIDPGEWQMIRNSVGEVRESVSRYLDGEPDMDALVPYSGSRDHLRDSGLTLRNAILRASAHHYFHIGEISTKRDRLGHSVGDYPGRLLRCL
ncbi:MAG: DinB family protein [Dehalococcoidia bacterium]|nr:DinB family protein [Dehalococcoidia bacterium]